MNSTIAKRTVLWAALSPLILLVLVIAIPIILIRTVYEFFRGLWLRSMFQRKWGSKGKNILLVYSESPNWQDYIEREIVPKVARHAVLLNYSKRAEWRSDKPLEAKVWEHWCGGKEYNPIAILVPERGQIRTIPFYQAFKDFIHGKSFLLRQKEKELFDFAAKNTADPA